MLTRSRTARIALAADILRGFNMSSISGIGKAIGNSTEVLIPKGISKKDWGVAETVTETQLPDTDNAEEEFDSDVSVVDANTETTGTQLDVLDSSVVNVSQKPAPDDTKISTQLSDTVKVLKNEFNKQFADLKAQHESETNALLEKLNEVTEQLKTLSEQSVEQISVLKDQLGGLGGQLGTIIGKFDMLGKGQNLSLRMIGLFDVAAKAGDGALEKLIGILGSNNTGKELLSVQSRLQSVSSRIGSQQSLGGLNLLA